MLGMCKLSTVYTIWNLKIISYLCRGVIGLLVNWMQHSDIVFVVVWVMAFCCLPSEVIGQLGYRSECWYCRGVEV